MSIEFSSAYHMLSILPTVSKSRCSTCLLRIVKLTTREMAMRQSYNRNTHPFRPQSQANTFTKAIHG